MARSIWKGALTFGLVSIPVELFSAEDRKSFKLSMLDKRDFSPVGYKRYSKRSGKEVIWNNIVKGYEYEKDQYVVLSDEDFKRANVKASRLIEVQRFVLQADIPPQYFESPYYLVPSLNGEKAYVLLRETLRSTGRVAVAQFVLHATQHLAAVGPSGRALMLYTLRYADEFREIQDSELPPEGLKSARVSTREVELAKRLIEGMADTWDARVFRDTYHQDLMTVIRKKIKKGETHEITPESEESAEAETPNNVIDLTALLKKSIESGARPARTKAPRKPRRAEKPDLRLVASGHSRRKRG